MMETTARRTTTLWLAVAGGPLAWSLDTLLAIAIDHDVCAHGARPSAAAATLPLFAIGIVAAAVTIAAGLTGWRIVAAGHPDTGLGDTVDDRARFMARFAMVISALCLFAIILRTITAAFISPAVC